MKRISIRYSAIAFSISLLAYKTIPFLKSNGQSFNIPHLLLYIASCLFSYYITNSRLIPYLIPLHLKADLYGKDIYLRGTPEFEHKLPECLGLGISVVYLCHIILLYGYFKLSHNQDLESVISQCFGYILSGVFLGFVDDILELQWRDKLIFPFFFSILLILNYKGSTGIALPSFLHFISPVTFIELSYFFYFYLICISIFCVNSINIYAGISGLESGQSLVIGLTLMLENLICMQLNIDSQENFYSLILLGPFCAASLALLRWNKVEAKTFVGDTYCYFAGSVFAACAIVGKFPVKILLFFLPQLFNFLISIPQLIGIVFCPRHRLPLVDLKTRKLTSTYPANLNLINFALWVTGPLTEQQLGDYLIALQVAVNLAVVFLLRFVD